MADDGLVPTFFGPADQAPDWRSEPDHGPDDDEELAETPADVVALLGFDPLDADDDEARADAQFKEVDHPRDETGRFASGGSKPLTKYELPDIVSTAEVPPKAAKALKDIGGTFHTDYAFASVMDPDDFRKRQAEQFDKYHSSGAEHERAARRQRYDGHTESILEGVRELDSLFASGQHVTKAPIVLQRGTVDSEIPSGLSVGSVMESPVFLSTTNKDSISKKYAGGISGPAQKPLRMKIEVPAGYPAVDVKAAGAQSFGEGEVLLPRGARFRILKLDREKGLATLEALPFAKDDDEARADAVGDDWREEDHPRGADGKFGSGGGGTAAVKRGSEYHKTEGERHRQHAGDKRSEAFSAARSHEKASAKYLEAFDHYVAGREEAGVISHKEAESLRREARAKERRHELGVTKGPAREEGPPEEQKIETPPPPPATPGPVSMTAGEVTRLAEMDHAAFKEKHGISAAVVPGATFSSSGRRDRVLGQARAAVAALPQAHRKLLAGRVSVRITDHIDLTGMTSTTGLTGKGVASGLFRPSHKHADEWTTGAGRVGDVQVADSCITESGKSWELSNLANTTSHELGHGVDEALGRPSGDNEFSRESYLAFAALTPAELRAAEYWTRTRSEVWAECYAVEHTPVLTESQRFFGGLSRERAREVFAPVIATMHRLTEERLAKVGRASSPQALRFKRIQDLKAERLRKKRHERLQEDLRNRRRAGAS